MIPQLRLFARDRPLNFAYCLCQETFSAPIILSAVFESSLLVYTGDNTFYHFLLVASKEGTRLKMCGSIGFEGVVHDPFRVRGMSWLVPKSQQRGFDGYYRTYAEKSD
jgi:RAB6A-GEF complex partner protein 1